MGDLNLAEKVHAPDFLHKEYPKQFGKREFWKQIKRTVNGKPVSENDICLIVSQIRGLLDLAASDHVLDLGCGNGALASQFFEDIDRYTGVDFSKYLLDIAGEFFRPNSKFTYVESDIRSVATYSVDALSVTKVLLYGCIGYLNKADTEQLLRELRDRLPSLDKVLIGNVPDRKQANDFFAKRNIETFDLDDSSSQIGVWWTCEEMIELAASIGYSARVERMPSGFYGSQYRFDLILKT